MPFFFAIHSTLLAAIYFLVLSSVVGFPAAKLFEAGTGARLLIAPALGFAIFGVVAAIAFQLLPFAVASIAPVAAASAALSVVIGRDAASQFHTSYRPGIIWLLAAIILSSIPALANVPHGGVDGIAFGESIFDHAKVAIVDEIARNGLPAHNPFFAGADGLLNYYFLWYLVAATVVRVTGVSGWEADVALTGVTALASLGVLAWAAVAWSRRPGAAWWVLAIAASASLRPFTGVAWMRAHMVDEHLLEGWLQQAAWVPQHMMAATFAILAIIGVVWLLTERALALRAGVLAGILIAASYDSSIWIGGFGLAAILPVLSLIGLWKAVPETRLSLIANLATAVVTALAFVAVFAIRNLAVVGHRKLVGLWVYPVLVGAGDSFGGRIANEIGFWLLLLLLDFGFAYVIALVWCLGLRRRWAATRDIMEPALALAIILPLLLAQFLVSTIANNDLGWRVVLIAVFAMTIVAASNAARWMASASRPWVIGAAVVLLLPGIASGLDMALRIDGVRPNAKLAANREFRDQPELWQAVRAVTPGDQAVLNNPNSFRAMTLWPANIGWALLSDRRNCAAGYQWLRSLAPELLPPDLEALDDRIDRVFSGTATPEDFRILKRDHHCSTLVVVPTDGLWNVPAMDDNAEYKLVDSRSGRWRIYR